MAERPPSGAPIIAIVGPTATGKTEVAALLAEAHGGEVISADSVAVYRGLDIGSAKPEAALRARVPFHLVDVADPDEAFSVARYREMGDQAIAGIAARGRQPLLAGGTGLYVRVLLEGYGLAGVPADAGVRQALNAEADRLGAAALYERLRELDGETAARLHPNDRVRIVRALEVLAVSGETLSAHQRRDREQRRGHPSVRFALTANRADLDTRIAVRVERMLKAGLEDEVRGLLDRGYGPELTSMRSLGYKEMADFVRGNITRDQAIEQIIGNTRRFARRQLTWFRSDPGLTWVDVGGHTQGQVAAEIALRLKEAGIPGTAH